MFTSVYLTWTNMTIILAEIVRMTLDGFWSEKSTICQRNISPLARGFAPEVNVAAIGRPIMAYLDVEKIFKIKVLNRFD